MKRIILSIFLMLSTVVQSEKIAELNYEFSKQVGLDEKAFTRYEELLKIKGLVPKNFRDDPVYVLGIFAKNDDEKRKYAKILMKREVERANLIFSFLEIYIDVYNEEYGTAPLLNMEKFKSSDKKLDLRNKRLVIFFDINCEDCKAISKGIESLVKLQKINGADFYFTNIKSLDEINQWATVNKMDVDLVNKKTITLNTGVKLANKLAIDNSQMYFIRDGDSLLPLQIDNLLDFL